MPWRALPLIGCLVIASACDQADDTRSAGSSEGGDPSQLPLYLQQTRQALGTGQFDVAATSARRGLELDSTHAELNNLLATALSAQGMNDEAVAAAERAVRHHPDDATSRLNLGGLYFRQQKIDLAQQQLTEAIRIDPSQPSLHRRLADLQRAAQRPDLAVESMRRARELDSAEAVYAFLLGLALEQTGAVADAIAAYGEAARLDPSLVEAYDRIVAIGEPVSAEGTATARRRLTRLRSLDPAQMQTFDQMRRGVLNSPEDAAQHYRLGAFLLQTDLVDEGIQKLERASQMQPGDARLLNHIGGLLSRAGRLDDALAFYHRAAEAMPTDATALLNAGSVHAQLGELDKAIPLYEQAMERAPDSPQIHFYYGLALTTSGQREEARDILEAGLALAQTDSALRVEMTRVLDALHE